LPEARREMRGCDAFELARLCVTPDVAIDVDARPDPMARLTTARPTGSRPKLRGCRAGAVGLGSSAPASLAPTPTGPGPMRSRSTSLDPDPGSVHVRPEPQNGTSMLNPRR